MRKDWPQVRITDVQIGNKDRQNIQVGDSLQVSAKVHLGAVDPKHVRVEAYHGEAENGALAQSYRDGAREGKTPEAGWRLPLRGTVPASESGTYGFSVRVVPTHPHLMQAHELRLIAWS